MSAASTSKLPQFGGSRLRPPSRLPAPSSLAPPSVAPISKRRASNDLPESSPPKRLRNQSSSTSSTSSNADGTTRSTRLMGPPTSTRSIMPAPRNKMRRSVSMAIIPLASGTHIAAGRSVTNSGTGIRSTRDSAWSSANRLATANNTSINSRPSSATTRAPLTSASARRVGASVSGSVPRTINRSTSLRRLSNSNRSTTVAGRKPLATAAGSALEKGRQKNTTGGVDVYGRLEDLEQVVRSLMSRPATPTETHNTAAAVSEHKENLSAVPALAELITARDEAQQQLAAARLALNEANACNKDKSSTIFDLQSRVETLTATVARKERMITELNVDLDLKMKENFNLKVSLSESCSVKSILESQLNSVSSQLITRDVAIQDLRTQLEASLNSGKLLKEKMLSGETLRKELHDKILELKGNIRVFCRVRPLLPDEIAAQGNSDIIHHIAVISENSLEVLKTAQSCDTGSMSGLKNRSNTATEFTYDRVFGPKHTQEEVFSEVSQLVQSALDGHNVCVFAYGQTGSGKTYTMEGSEADPGIISRTARLIFEEKERLKEHGWEYTIETSVLEIYNESIRDLLADAEEAKNLHYDIKLGDGRSPFATVTNLKVEQVADAAELEQHVRSAAAQRAVAATNMNQHSSRSHSVFRILISGYNAAKQEKCQGSLSLVDLAGSERLKESGSTGARLTETQNINTSLSSLGNVIMALGKKQSHIPYRNSKLTTLLQGALGGSSSKTLMLVAVSPLEQCHSETINSLRFATKVNNCHIGVSTKATRKV